MIKKLELEDICHIRKVKTNISEGLYLDYNYQNNISPIIKTQKFSLNKTFTSTTKDDLLFDLIKKFKLKSYKGTIYELRFDYEKNWINTEIGVRKLMAKILMLGNSIAVNGRQGPLTGIIIDSRSNILTNDKFINDLSYNIYTFDNLGEKIIAFRKPENNIGYTLLINEDNLYNFQESGDYSHQYDVLSLSKIDLRKYKLERILN